MRRHRVAPQNERIVRIRLSIYCFRNIIKPWYPRFGDGIKRTDTLNFKGVFKDDNS